MSLIKQLPDLFSAGVFMINHKVLVVLHENKEDTKNDFRFVYKLPGGTFMGDEANWIAKGEGGGYYNILSTFAVMQKLEKTLNRVFGQEVISKHQEYINDVLSYFKKRFIKSEEIHLIIEFIEETGIIPLDVEIFETTPKGTSHVQYFFKIIDACTYINGREDFILIKDLENDLPVKDEDFHCTDADILRYEVLDIGELLMTTNIARSHAAALKQLK
jgi:hypothetical protein